MKHFNDDMAYYFPPRFMNRMPMFHNETGYSVPVISSVGTGPSGSRGEPFTYEDFTEEQLNALRGPQGEQGVPGPKGAPFVYEDFTGEQLDAIREGIVSTYYRCIDASYVTPSGVAVSTIPIPIDDYSPIDTLFVNINGLDLVNNVDYVINNGNIVLSTPITHGNTKVNFRALKIVALSPDDHVDLMRGYISHGSFVNFINALSNHLNVTINETYDSENQEYTYSISNNII